MMLCERCRSLARFRFIHIAHAVKLITIIKNAKLYKWSKDEMCISNVAHVINALCCCRMFLTYSYYEYGLLHHVLIIKMLQFDLHTILRDCARCILSKKGLHSLVFLPLLKMFHFTIFNSHHSRWQFIERCVHTSIFPIYCCIVVTVLIV